jgi:cell division septal protein FtsQ
MFRRRPRVSRAGNVKKFGLFRLRTLKILGIFLAIVGMIVFGWWFFTQVKTDFSIKLDDLACANESQIKQSLEKQRIRFYWLQSQEIDKKLRSEFPCINESRIERQFPKGVIVSVSGRKPLAVFRVTKKTTPSPLPIEVLEATPSTSEARPSPSLSPSPQVIVTFGETFLMDGKGVGFAKGFREDLPLINYVADRFDIGDNIGAESISQLLLIIDFFQKQAMSIESIELDHDKLTIKSAQEFIFSVSQSLERQIASLQLIWKQAKMNSKSVVKIDLRFDKPVVIYAPEKR